MLTCPVLRLPRDLRLGAASVESNPLRLHQLHFLYHHSHSASAIAIARQPLTTGTARDEVSGRPLFARQD